MIPILIVIPFWERDRTEAIDLCRIMAGLQSAHVGQAAHVALTCRNDSKIDPNMVKIISSRFNTLTHRSNSPLKGWPAGANGMFGDAMIWVSNSMVKNYECVYWLEPDAIPLCPNWFADLTKAWRTRPRNANIVGCRSDCNGDGTGDHITGCALYHPNIARIMPGIATCDNMAWDYQLRAKIVAMGQHTPLIENWYKQSNIPAATVYGQQAKGVVIFHGVKDDSVRKAVKSKYNIS